MSFTRKLFLLKLMLRCHSEFV